MELSNGSAGSQPPPKVIKLSGQQRQELELLFQECPRPSPALLEGFLRDRPLLSNLDKHFLKSWFQSRRLKEKRDEKLSPLIQKNAELKAEHQSLLVRNSQLRNQTLLLNLENQRLKEQLELQLQKRQLASSSLTVSSKAQQERDSDEEDLCESPLCYLESSLDKVNLADGGLSENSDSS